MSFNVIIDKEKCKRDGICVSECPERAIEIGSDGYPAATEDGETQCIECGHCVAFCPHGAFSLDAIKPENCDETEGGVQISPEQVGRLIRTRRSIRTYKKKAVERNVIEKLIDLARYAPTAKNLQPVHWTVVKDSASVQDLSAMVIDWMRSMLAGRSEAIFSEFLLKLIVSDAEKGGDWICRGAPNLIVVHGPTDLPIPASQSGCTIALTTLELAAPVFGLGTCWAGYFNAAANNYHPLKDALRLPSNHEAFGAMMIGSPVYECKRIPPRKAARIRWL